MSFQERLLKVLQIVSPKEDNIFYSCSSSLAYSVSLYKTLKNILPLLLGHLPLELGVERGRVGGQHVGLKLLDLPLADPLNR